MSDLITNGYFEEDDDGRVRMAPWELCDRGELGELWTCLEDEEPDFPRMSWVFSRGAEITDENWIFLSTHNVRLSNNDGIVQEFEPGARATGELSLWAHCGPPIESEGGTLYVFVCYRDRTFAYDKTTRRDIFNFAGPKKLVVELEDKAIEKVVICVAGAAASWFINGITIPEPVEAKSMRHPFESRRFIEDRISVLEAQVERLFRMTATARPPVSDKPGLSLKEVQQR